MLKKICRCGKVIPYGTKVCDKCKVKVELERKQNIRYYKQTIHERDSKYNKFYNSDEWLSTRATILAKYKGLDLYAFFVDNEIAYANTVHHIEELKDNWDRRIDILNLIPLTKGNHSKIHKLYLKDKKNTQKLLYSLLSIWNKKMNGEGEVKKF